MKYFCSWQKEVTAALRLGELSDAQRAHLNACPVCADLVLVTQAFGQARMETIQVAGLNSQRSASPGLLWWRAQLLQRNNAVERVTRPVVFAEKISLISILLVSVGLLFWQRGSISDWMSSFDLPDSVLPLAFSNSWAGVLLIASFGTFLLFSSLAVYLLAKKE